MECVFGHSFGIGPRKQDPLDSVRDLIWRTRPYAVLFEEIHEFMTVHPKIGKSPCKLLLEDLLTVPDPDCEEGSPLYTSVRVYPRSASNIAHVSRNRTAVPCAYRNVILQESYHEVPLAQHKRSMRIVFCVLSNYSICRITINSSRQYP